MAKRNVIDQLDEAVQAAIANREASGLDATVAPLARLAVDLRDLPRESFKKRLKADLQKKSKEISMATAVERPSITHTVATPRLTFKDPGKAIDFYKNAFGAKEAFRFEEGGRVAHAEITIGDSSIMLAQEWPEGGRLSAETWGHSPVQMELEVTDADAFAEHALAAGMKEVTPIADQFYGYREGTFIDPFGYRWTISTKKEDVSAEEMHRRFNAFMQAEQAKKPRVEAIPKGYRTLTPYLIAKDGPALVDFVKRAFGAEEISRGTGGAGGIHCELRIGDSMIMAGGGRPGYEFRSQPAPTALHVFVDDTDAAYQRALDAGATSTGAPRDHDYGERGASVKDAFGNYWYIASWLNKSDIREGLHSVNLYLHPQRAPQLIDFMRLAFGATELFRAQTPDGIVQHAEVKIGSSIVEMGEAHGPYQPMPAAIYLYVPDTDAVYQQALRAGATSLYPPADQPYGDRNAGVKDASGHTWYIATHIKEVKA